MAPGLAAAPLCPPGPPNVAGLHPGAVSRGSCPAGCRVGRSFCAALAHCAPTVLAPWPPLGSDRTSPPEGRGLWLGPPGQASLAGRSRRRRPSPLAPRPPRPRQPQQEACGRALVRSSARKSSRHAPRLSPRSASSQLRVRSDRPARRWGNRGPWEPHVRGVRSAPDSLWEGHSAPSARPAGGLHSRGPSLQTGLATAKGSEPVPCVSLGRASLSTRPHA